MPSTRWPAALAVISLLAPAGPVHAQTHGAAPLGVDASGAAGPKRVTVSPAYNTLPPEAYTAVLPGASGEHGVALIEACEVP